MLQQHDWNIYGKNYYISNGQLQCIFGSDPPRTTTSFNQLYDQKQTET